MHEHSLEAYELLRPDLSRRHAHVFGCLKLHGPLSDRQVRDRLGYEDMNQVRPRITELVQAGELEEIDERYERGRRVRVVAVANGVQESLF